MTQRYGPAPDEEEKRLESRLLELVRAHSRYGYRRMTTLLQREGWRINRKRMYRLWRRQPSHFLIYLNLSKKHLTAPWNYRKIHLSE